MSLFSNHPSQADRMFQDIYETYNKRVFAIVTGKIKDRDDILDVMQNVFFHLWIYRESITKENSESIIIKTCKQEISNFISLQKKQPITQESAHIKLSDDSDEMLESALEKEEQLNAVQLSMELLPISRKQILTLNKMEGITQEKIADQFGLSKKAVEKQISKAVQFLRNRHKNS